MSRTSRIFWITSTLVIAAGPLRAAVCRPSFPVEHNKPFGWQGADAAYSIPLNDGRTVWIFGDTLYGPERVVKNNEPRMVRNSLGVSRCDSKGNWNLKYVIRLNKNGHPQDTFVLNKPDHWYWAMDGFAAHGDLWVTLLCLRTSNSKQAAMNFETCGADLAQVSHLERDPQQWEITIHPLVACEIHAYPSAAALVEGGYAYIFVLYETGTRSLLVTRLPLSDLADAAEHLEYLASDGTWKHGFDPTQAKEVMKTGSSELSVRYHPELKKWLAVMVDPGRATEKILLRTAPKMTGPWTSGEVVYRMPEMIQGNPRHVKDNFCYAAKEHPEFERNGELLFTYVCNTMDVPSLAGNLSIYFPKVVSIPMPRRIFQHHG